MLDAAFAALKEYDWGTDLAPLAPIEDAVAQSHDKPDARRDLENRLVVALQSDISRDAKDYVCRKLAIVGTAGSVSALAPLLGKPEHSHMARLALESMPAPEAGEALRQAVGSVSDELKIGMISSLGTRREASAVPVLKGLLGSGNPAVARAAALALGSIGSVEAVAALQTAATSAGSNPAVTDGLLACAEALLASQKQGDALAIYRSLAGDGQGRLVRLAATRGILACTSRQS